MIAWVRRQKAGTKVLALLTVALVVMLFAISGMAEDPDPPVQQREETIATPLTRGAAETIPLDATVYLPDQTPAPAVLLAHGFGGTKQSVAAQARRLTREGYVVLAYTARGFGKSGGTISLNAPDREVADASTLVDWLATQPEVRLDGRGDPRVAVVGGSYGGALALSAGGTDPRIDAVIAAITWNDLGAALFPNVAPADAPTPAAAGNQPGGVLKSGWTGALFGSATGPDARGAPATDPCGRFDPIICRPYEAAAASGRPTPELLELLRRHSPTATNARLKAPTLLLQGEVDTLFGLDQADANAREITAAGGKAAVEWFYGGHSASSGWLPDRSIREFLDSHLRNDREFDARFRYSLVADERVFGQSRYQLVTAPEYPGLATGSATEVGGVTLRPAPAPTGPGAPAAGSPAEKATGAPADQTQTIVRPPGANPAALSSLPAIGALLAAIGQPNLSVPIGQIAMELPGQAAIFTSDPLTENARIVGAPTVTLTVSASVPGAETALYAKIYDEDADGKTSLIGSAVSPLRLPDATPANTPVTMRVPLPAMAHQFPSGHRIRVTVATTDQAYATPSTAATYRVSLADPQLTMPTVGGTVSGRDVPTGKIAAIAGLIGGAIIAGLLVAFVSRRRRAHDADESLLDVPLAIDGLSKSYGTLQVVDDVSFRIEHGQVLGLLGPNGAGKTTTLRMLMGLITPSGGEIRVFGHRIVPGAPVLSRIGSFVEGPGFIPGLSGRRNLELYWAATGRPLADARMDEALEIAALGVAVERKVRGYSQGMRQRLAIAQAMLGLPDLLVLDEPTNGLDPPQIRAMRDVLKAYAERGRTVLVSSHLLAEVEQTCTHVVVMHRGRVLRAGSVAELTDGAGTIDVAVDDIERALAELGGDARVTAVGRHPRRPSVVQAHLVSVADRAAVVRRLVDASVEVSAVGTSNSLEDVFLDIIASPVPAADRQPQEVTT